MHCHFKILFNIMDFFHKNKLFTYAMNLKINHLLLSKFIFPIPLYCTILTERKIGPTQKLNNETTYWVQLVHQLAALFGLFWPISVCTVRNSTVAVDMSTKHNIGIITKNRGKKYPAAAVKGSNLNRKCMKN